MNLSWYGENCFKIKTKPKRGNNEIIIFTDIFDKNIGLRPPQGQSDIITLSNDYNYSIQNAKKLKGNPFIIDSAGEYALKNIDIRGIESFADNEKGIINGRNTIFTIQSEDIKICHLGNLGHSLNEKQIENIGNVDILLIGVGNSKQLTLKIIKEIIGQLEPGIIIPMNYKVKKLKTPLQNCQEFCDEFGGTIKQKEKKITIKTKEVKEMENHIIILNVN